ncbi:MAG: hypothetical protein NT075_17595 [Chloroflexi bacterium]|nr:hypothetical protein [Chloroflexota bacterium]
MFDYALSGGLPAGSRTAWSQHPLQPLVAVEPFATPPLTPFSYSLLAEVAGRAWFQYFDRLGFDPMPRARIMRQYQGRPYLNLTLSAQRDAEFAGLEPLTLRLDGQLFPLFKWEKPGFVAGIKAGLNQKKIEDTLKNLSGELDVVTQMAQQWRAKTQELRWTQAEILQIMEEIEDSAVPAFIGFLAARYQLEVACNRLIRLTLDKLDAPTALTLMQAATSDVSNLVEQAMGTRLRALGDLAVSDPATVAWLKAGVFEDWSITLPNPHVTAALREFLTLYGHRCVGEGEIRQLRWRQDPAPLLRAILADASHPGSIPEAPSAAQSEQKLIDAVASGRRKEAQQLLQKIRHCLALQSRSLHAFAYILDATRGWALAAAKEAMIDQRLLELDDVFFFELEEMKRMMTGEWNVSDRPEIQATCARRKAEFAQLHQGAAPELLIGEAEAKVRDPNAPPNFGSLWPLVGM